MYHLINNNVQHILQSISPIHVTEYDFLVHNIQHAGESDYQERYKKYWRLYGAGLSQSFFQAYFQHLQAGLNGNPPQLGILASQLYQIPIRPNKQALQFAFSSKLCHMLDLEIPIYDSMIRGFYFFTEPDRKLTIQQRIDGYVQFHQFLINEYNRVLNEGILATSIQAFRHHLNPKHFTDVKVIDSLIWAFISLLRNGGLMKGMIVYC